MKKILLFIACITSLFSLNNAKAQTFSVADTVWQTVAVSGSVLDPITNLTGNRLSLRWSVISTTFPSDWLTDTSLNICDDSLCRINSGGIIWNGTSGTAFTPSYYANSAHDSVGDFHLQPNYSYATSTGTHYLTIKITDVTGGGIGGTTANTTFAITRIPTGITNVNNPENDIVLYPNPTHDELNIVYDPANDIKSIVIYNIIGKTLNVYKVTANNSANLNLENIPSGIYFVRLFNSHGDVVVTRKFTKQ